MAKQYTREQVKARFNDTIAAGHPVIISGAGIGLSAKCAERGGVDMIGLYDSGKFRMDGNLSTSGRLPFMNGNEIVLELADRIMPIIQNVPVCAGICGSDPTREMRTYFKILQFYGFSAVMNFPTYGDLECAFRNEIEAAGLGVHKEIDNLALAKEMGFFTLAYAFDEDIAAHIGKSGIDVMIVHLGLTKGGSFVTKRASKMTLEEAAVAVNRITTAARRENPGIMVFAHGGPISSPSDTEYIYANTASVGFLGASSVERIPVETAVMEKVKALKSVRLK